MKIRTLAGSVITAGLIAAGGVVLATPAYADGGCPSGGDWNLLPTSLALSVDNGNVQDQNGDGLACFKVNKGQTEKNGGFPTYTWKDNTNPS